MRQDAPRHDVDPDDRLSDFDSEVQNPAFDKNESDIAFHTHEHGAARDGSESGAIYDSRELDLAFGRKEPDGAFGRENLDTVFNRQRDITSGTRKGDIQPDPHVRPVQAPSVQPFMRYTSGPVVHKSTRRNLVIALLVLGSIGALAWSGRWLMGMRRDAGTSGAQIQTASQPTPTVPREAPTNVLPPAPAPQPPATDVPAETATPSEPAAAIATPSAAPGANAPDAPPAERPELQAERPPVNTDPNAAGGLFAITRPLGAQVFLDNKLIGTTPLFMSQLSSGSHEVRLELPGFNTYSSSIQVEPDRQFRLAVQLEASR